MKITDNIHAFLWESTTENNCNTYLVTGPSLILIDPGHRQFFDHVEKGLEDIGKHIEDIDLVIATHVHPDHMDSIPLFKETKAMIAFHELGWNMLKSAGPYLQRAYGATLDAFMPDIFLTEGELIVKGTGLEIFQTPGHSPGSITLYKKEDKALFTGDLVFQESVGRTDLPGGDTAVLAQSIKKISDLDVDFLLPGHGQCVEGSEKVSENYKTIEQFVLPRM